MTISEKAYGAAVKACWRKDEIIQYLLDVLVDIEAGGQSAEVVSQIARAAIEKVERDWVQS